MLLIPLILGYPFPATANVTINSKSSVMDVLVMNMRLRLNIFKTSSQHVLEDESECFFVYVIDRMIEEVLPAMRSKDILGTCLPHGDLRLFNLGITIDDMDSTFDSTPHLDLPFLCTLMSLSYLGKFSYAILS